jgi:very-short-patch-repair endonuclease
MHLLRREINKQRRHIPIRQLIKRAGNALQALKPCFMMGPLSVAQYLEQGVLKFDLVVMDEASQLRPEEALGAIARGNQLVVVGDPKQLPPTSFFDRMVDSGDGDEEEDEAPAAISGMESILDICQQLFTPVRSLRWHYRSQHESLIAFSNHHFYKNLVVFPSPYAKNPGLGVKYRYVRSGLYRDRQNKPEAQRVVDAVLEHMIKRPEESLGVVTLNQTQRELIEDLLDKKLKTFKEGVDFLGHWENEGWPFFVKNLENVQGDERDVIFISTTFGKVPGTDKVRQNFGPISRPDGWRRLNVLFTRSKRRIELFTSMSPEDIVVDEKTPLGTKALRDYLDFAKFGILVATDENVREPDSDFEISVANVVTAMGYEVKPQLGVAGFFIDMAVRNPDRPGEFLAGIECDGATYHGGHSVRDRDRIRQEILESLGWKSRIHRIWSTDWFYNPRKEVGRLRDFLEERHRLSAVEAPDEWEESEDQILDIDSLETPEVIEELVENFAASAGDEDAFVEVGDRVTYDFVDDPKNRHSVFIVDSASNPKMGIINELTPVAQALLGLSLGDVGELKVPGQKIRQLRLLKIHRQEELLA